MGRPLPQPGLYRERNRLVSETNSLFGLPRPPVCRKGSLSEGDRVGLSEWNKLDKYGSQERPHGKPFFSFNGKAREVVETRKVDRVFLTLSDERPYALAHVILEGRGDEGSDR